jgi:hypothetical protein
MNAPVSHHPLVVNTADGSCWTRRAVTPEGRGLYALAGSVAGAPDEVLAPLAELAELGIVGSAYALPMPVGPVLRSELDQARDDVMGACLARWEEEQDNARLRLALKSAQRGRREARGLYEITEASRKRWRDALIKDRGELETLRARVAELEYVAPSPSCTRCYGADAVRFVAQGGASAPCPVCGPLEVERLRARVAELKAVIATECARHVQYEDSPHCQLDGEFWPCGTVAALEPVDGIMRRIAPTQALREDESADPCHPCGCPKRFNRHAWGCPTLPELEPVAFAAVEDGDRVRFLTADNGYGGQGDVWRIGTVVKVTAKTVVVDCDTKNLSDTAVLRESDWNARSVQRVLTSGGRDLPESGGAQ